MVSLTDIAHKPMVIMDTAEETVQAVAMLCRDYDAQAWLFGSQARGTSGRWSDIDIAVRAPRFEELEEAIQNLDTMFRLDIVDLTCPYDEGIEDGWIRIA